MRPERVEENKSIRLHGQAVKTPPFHGGNRGSNPLGVIYNLIWRRSQVVRQRSATPLCAGSNPADASKSSEENLLSFFRGLKSLQIRIRKALTQIPIHCYTE